jgi:hypothetical protein
LILHTAETPPPRTDILPSGSAVVTEGDFRAQRN